MGTPTGKENKAKAKILLKSAKDRGISARLRDKKNTSKLRKDASDPVVLAKDGTPLDYMLAVVRDSKASMERRDRMAIAAAQYCHRKMLEQPRSQFVSKRHAAIEAAEAAAADKNGNWTGLLHGDDD